MGHTYSNILIHVIFSTKDRALTIGEDIRERLYQYMAGLAREECGRAWKIGGTDNHVHALLSIRADVSISEAMRKWKSLSSGWVHQTFPGHDGFAWQLGYGAFSVSQSNADHVTEYIGKQGEHHRKVTFEEEFIALLDRHGIQYDREHIWD